MTINVPNWFIEAYNNEVQVRGGTQRARRLAGATRGGGTFVGDSVFFPRMGHAEMYDSPRMAQLAMANVEMDMIEVKAKPKFIMLGIWDPDKSKLSVSLAQEYARTVVEAGHRAEDRLIIEALDKAAVSGVTNTKGATEQVTTIGDYDSIAGLDMVAEGVATLGALEMFEGQRIIAVQPFRLKTFNALDPYMAKNDVKDNLPWNDIDWRTYERLFGNGTNREGWITHGSDATGVDTYLFAQSAVRSDYNDQMQKILGRDERALTDFLGSWFQGGATVTEPMGVLRIKSKANFDLARTPTPIIDVTPAG